MPCEYNTKTFKLCRCACKWRCKCLIPRKKKPPPPFNHASERDNKIGLHPKLYAKLSDSPAVGSYNLPQIKKKDIARSWKRELETKEFSETMGGRLPNSYIVERILSITGRGPGTHEIPQWPEIVLKKQCKSNRRNVSFGTTPRLVPEFKSFTPGPGYTLKVPNPYYYLEQNRFKSFSSVPSFEYDGLKPRFRDTKKSWNLPCNLYNVKHPLSLDAFLKKKTGKRGPYDLFTGPRDNSTIKGYMASQKFTDFGDGLMYLPGCVEKLLHKSNYYKGRWSTCPRFPKMTGLRMMLQDTNMCYRDPEEPGPGYYEPKSPKKLENKKKYPFNSNIDARSIPRYDICPPVGRYNIKDGRCVKGMGWTWMFKSNVPRTIGIYLPKTYANF